MWQIKRYSRRIDVLTAQIRCLPVEIEQKLLQLRKMQYANGAFWRSVFPITPEKARQEWKCLRKELAKLKRHEATELRKQRVQGSASLSSSLQDQDNLGNPRGK
jgi:hypothetical protein